MTPVELDDPDIEISVDGEVPVYRHRGSLYTGQVNEVRNGRLASTFRVSKGYQDGEELIFRDNGELESRLHYAQGVASGKVEHFHPGGSLAEDATFEFGICLASTSYDTHGAVTQRYALAKDSSDHARLEHYRKRVRGA